MADLSDPDPNPKDHIDSGISIEANEPILNGTVSGGSQHSSRPGSQQASQQPPIKVLIRPVSSGRDPAAGFSFAKVGPMQQLDFRRPKQAAAITQSPGLSHPLERVPTVETSSHQSPHPATVTETVRNVPDTTGRQSPVTEDRNVGSLEEPLPVAVQSAIPVNSHAPNHQPVTSTSGPIKLDLSSIRSPRNEDSMTVDESVTNRKLNGTKVPCPLNIIIPGPGKSTLIPPAHMHNHIDVTEGVDQPQVSNQNRSRQASRDLLTSVAGTPKITKNRQRTTKTRPLKEGAQTSSNTKGGYTDDDLFRLLMYRRSQGQQELEHFRAMQQQKDIEIQNLREMSGQLSTQLEDLVQREALKTAELSKIKARKPVWERKIKHLSDYVKGLTNDHKRLREDSDDLRKQYEDIFVAREEWHSTLTDAQKSMEQERVKFQELKNGAQSRIEALVHTVQSQSDQLKSDESLLLAERERSNRLEDRISSINAGHGKLLELFNSHRDSITDRLDGLLNHAQTLVPPERSSELHSDDLIRPMLEQCLEMLQRLQEARTVKPDELKNLNDTIDRFIQGYLLALNFNPPTNSDTALLSLSKPAKRVPNQ